MNDEPTKRLLLVSYIFPPMVGGGVHRTQQTCKYLPEFGWRPTVLTVRTSDTANTRLIDELPEGVEVVRAHCPMNKVARHNQPDRISGWRRTMRRAKRWAARMAFFPDWQILWYPWAVAAGKRLLRQQRFDAVMASYTPATSLLVGARLARWAGLPLVLDFRDIWADNPTPVWPTPLHRWACRRLERCLVRQARKVVAVSPPMTRHLARRHQRAEQDVVCITNGFDPAHIELVRDRRAPGDPARPRRICFTGSIYGATDLTAFFEAVAQLKREGRVSPEQLRIQFVGNMTIDQPQQQGVAEFVDIHGPVAHHCVFDFYAAADVLMLIEMRGYHARFSYVSKLFDYMLAGKPILALAEPSEMTAAVTRELGGVVASSDDVAAIRQALLNLLSEPAPFRRPQLDQQPWCRFSRRRLTQRLAQVLDEAAGWDAGPNSPIEETRGETTPVTQS